MVALGAFTLLLSRLLCLLCGFNRAQVRGFKLVHTVTVSRTNRFATSLNANPALNNIYNVLIYKHMKVLISNEALQRHARSIPAHMGYTTNQFSWRDTLSQFTGKWVTVETQHLFEDQFNIVEGNLRIDAKYLDDIDFEEIGDFEAFKSLVTERYAKDWPGNKPNFFAIKQVLHRAGKGVDPVRENEILRGYDNEGKSIK